MPCQISQMNGASTRERVETIVVGGGQAGLAVGYHLAQRGLPFVILDASKRVGDAWRNLVLRLIRFAGHHILTVRTPPGRKMHAKLLSGGAPLVRTKPRDLDAARVERVPRVVGVRNGLPLLEDQRVLEVANVIWCTGFEPGFSWIDLPVLDENQRPMHERGIVAAEPGLYFVGLLYLYAMSSAFLLGVGRDARHVVEHLAARRREEAAHHPALAAAREVP